MKYQQLTVIILLLQTLLGCGGGGSGSDSTAPQISSTSPLDGARGVARNAIINAQFDKDILNTSVNNASAMLTLNGTPVAATVSFNGASNTATITPTEPLTPLGGYTTTVTTGITDLTGNQMASDTQWSFTVREGQWQAPVLIEINSAGSANFPQIEIDNAGNAIAVWIQHDGTRFNIWANRFTPTGGWATAQLIESNNDGDSISPQIDIDRMGIGHVVWYQSDGTRDNIWANRFTPASGWGAAELIESNNAGSASCPQIATDDAGNAIAVWSQFDGTRNNIWANRSTPASGWGAPELIENNNVEPANCPQIAVDNSGNAIAVWDQFDGTRPNVWANRFTLTGGWGSAELIETDNTGGARDIHVAVDNAGNAIAVWGQSDGSRTNIWANRFTPSTGWGAAELIETTNAGGALNPRIVIDRDGNAIATWSQSDGTRFDIWANRFTVTNGWGTAELIETNDAGDSFAARVAFDNANHALAVQVQSNGLRFNIWANRFTPTDGWAPAELIETLNAGDATAPQIAIDNTGSAIAVWTQSDGTRTNIYAGHFE